MKLQRQLITFNYGVERHAFDAVTAVCSQTCRVSDVLFTHTNYMGLKVTFRRLAS